MKVLVRKSPNPMKKLRAVFPDGRTVDFGATGYSDFTLHKDPERMRRYVMRHGRGREDWGKSGMYTAGFWSRWLLWSRPSVSDAARYIQSRFGLSVKFVK
jgi:hypothetical protein